MKSHFEQASLSLSEVSAPQKCDRNSEIFSKSAEHWPCSLVISGIMVPDRIYEKGQCPADFEYISEFLSHF